MIKIVLIRPLVTEKTSRYLEEENKYVFIVGPDVNKIEIRQAFEKQFSVKVEAVNLIRLKPKKRRRGRILGESKERRKAIITIEKGKVIDEIKKLF
jgi:large subunit ribosomal protein L23